MSTTGIPLNFKFQKINYGTIAIGINSHSFEKRHLQNFRLKMTIEGITCFFNFSFLTN